MKRQFIYSALLFSVLCLGTTGCSDDNGETDGPIPTPPPTGIVATMEEAQQEIEAVGQELAQKINADDLQPFVSLVNYCTSTMLGETDVINGSGISPFMYTMQACAKGDIAWLASKRNLYEIYQISDLYGKWEWDETEHQWNQIDDGQATQSGVYLFKDENGNDCVAELKGEGNVFELTDKDSEIIRVPETVTGTVTVSGRELATLTIHTTACSYTGKDYAASASFETCGYRIQASVSDNNSQASITAEMFKGTESLIKMQGNLTGNNLADFEMMDDGYFDGSRDLKGGTIACNILGRMSLNIQADNNSGQLAEALDYDGYYFHMEGDTTGTLESVKGAARIRTQAAVDAANQYSTAVLYFNNSTYSVPIVWGTYLYEYSYPGSYYQYGEWSAEPMLKFEDGSTYTFEDYFTTARFGSVLEAFEQLGREFENL